MNLLIAASRTEGMEIQKHFPQFRKHILLTPKSLRSGVLVGEYVWTPGALELPARLRMKIRGVLAPMIDEESVEETFPVTLLT
jgi:hypothetical protein